MRHVFGFVFGFLVAGILLLGTGWATQGAVRRPEDAVALLGHTPVLVGLGAMGAVGLVFGLVLAGRVSPMAVFVPSIVLLCWTVVYVLDVDRALSLVPDAPGLPPDLLRAGQGMQTLLTSGVYAMMGIALFIPVLMPSRWARPEHDDDDFEESRFDY